MTQIKTLFFFCWYKSLASRRKDKRSIVKPSPTSVLHSSPHIFSVLKNWTYSKRFFFVLIPVLTTFLYWKIGHILSFFFFSFESSQLFCAEKQDIFWAYTFSPFSKSDEEICQSFSSLRGLKLLLSRPNWLCFSNVPLWPCPPHVKSKWVEKNRGIWNSQ